MKMTKEEFKRRWDSGPEGGGITNEDCADCFVAWGLGSQPRTMPINHVVNAVVSAAGCSKDNSPQKMADKQKTLADIVTEIREIAERFHNDYLNDPVEFEGYERIANEFLTLAHEIEVAAVQEAAKLIPAKNIEFSDGNGRRQVSQGWVKVGGKPLASRPATKQDMEADKAKWCFVCTTDCPLRGSDVLVICGHFKKSEVSV